MHMIPKHAVYLGSSLGQYQRHSNYRCWHDPANVSPRHVKQFWCFRLQ